MGVLITHRCLSGDGASKEVEPVQQQFLLVAGVIDGEAVCEHPGRIVGT